MENLHIYLRVSSETQMTDGFGLENQKEVGIKLCEKFGMNPILHNEGSKSSHTDNIEDRPILSQLMMKVEEGEVKNLYVYNNDRLSRNENVWFHIRMKLKNNGVTLYVGDGTKYNLDHPMDEFIFGIMSEVSKYDNSIRTERLRRGKLSKIKSGGWKGGPPPFGYELVDGFLVPHSYEKRWVRKIYEEYSEGKSIYQIKRTLMKNGVKSRRGLLVWSEHSIRKILENTHFEGYYFYTDKKLGETIKVDCPKLLPMTLVKKVRKRLSEQTYKSNYTKYETLLRDFLVCGHCGSKYGQRISKSQYKKHYFCRGNSERLRTEDGQSDFICKTNDGRVRSLHIDMTDEFVWSNVVEILERSHLFKELFKKELMSEKKSFGQSQYEIKKIERKIKKNNQTIKDINETMNSTLVDGILDHQSKDNYKSLIKEFEKKKIEVQSEIEELMDLIYQSKRTTKWVDWVEDFRGKIDNLKNSQMTIEEKRKFLEGVVEKIVVKTEDKQTHSLEIQFVSPFVGDKFEWNKKKSPSKGYVVSDGDKNLITHLQSNQHNSKKR